MVLLERDMSVVELQAPTVGASHRPDVPCRRLECDHSAPLPDRDSPRGAHPNTVPKRPFHHPLPQFSSHRPQTWHVVCILQDSVVCQVSRLSDKRQRRTFEITFGHPNTGVRIVPDVKTREDLEREVEYNVYACCHFKRLNQRARQDSRSAHGGCCRPGLKVAATRLNVHGSSPKLPHIKSKAQYVGMFKLITGWIVETANPEQI